MSQQTDKIKTLSNANEEETEIDLLELFYYLKAKLVWLIQLFRDRCSDSRPDHLFSDHTQIYSNL